MMVAALRRLLAFVRRPVPPPGPGGLSAFGVGSAAALREAERSVRALTQVVDENPTMVMMTGPDNRIVYVNRAFELGTGYAFAEVRGRAPAFMVSDRTPIETWDSLGRALAEGAHWRGEIHNVAKDGSVWLSDSQAFALREPGGGVTHYVASMRDITEQRRRERELATAREAALSAARAKNELLQNVSHELRTPLNGIMGIAELLLHTPLSAEQRGDLLQLRRCSDELLTVVTHLFDFARIESDGIRQESTRFRLRASLAEVEQVLAAEAGQRRLSWCVDVDPGMPDELVGDPGMLRRILLNLASNAVKFTETGTVALTVAPELVADTSVTVRFEMHDTGIGIAPEQQAEIFEAFSQVDGSSTRKYGGVGLGLALASRLVRQLGGQLGVESTPGVGSTFSFCLVMGRALGEVAADAPAARVAKPLADARVLLVTRAGLGRPAVCRAIEAAGAEAFVTHGPEDTAAALARAAAAGTPITGLVLDQREGSFDGFALFESLGMRGLQRPPTILLVAAGRPGDAERCRELGIASYLTAPLWDEDIVESLRYQRAPIAERRAALVPRPAARSARAALRVLLVDDNAVNRKVASRLLERSGYEVVTAVDGGEGVERFGAGGWDLVLMDVQMPEMDGLEATRRIRAHEAAAGLARTPILALTAHTLDSDHRAVIAAGMDALIAKPIQPELLLATMQRHLGFAPAARGDRTVSPGLRDVLDWDEALERMEGDVALLRQLLRIFRADAPGMLVRLQAAALGGDPHELERSAHALKGASATISARRVHDLARTIEDLAREGQGAEARARMADVEREFERLVRALDQEPRQAAA